MVGVRKWLRTKLKSNPKKQSQPSRSPLPLLPASGPRTPVPATTSGGVGTSQSQLLLDSYGYFALLPCELRDQILREAFGNRTLHIDLTYDFPLVRRARRPQVDHAEEHPSHCGLGHELARDASQPKGWQWFSCVCHRKKSYSEDELKQREYAMRRLRTIEPRDDQCLEGSMTECDPGGSACFIGVMGWLLSCRMAYVSFCFVLLAHAQQALVLCL